MKDFLKGADGVNRTKPKAHWDSTSGIAQF